MKTISYIFKCPIYHTRICFIYTKHKKYKKLFKEFPMFKELFHKKDEIYAHAIKSWVEENGEKFNTIYIVLSGGCKYNPLTYGTLAHEAFHASGFILDHKGYVPDINNEEPQAYLIEYIMDELCTFLKEKCNFDFVLK